MRNWQGVYDSTPPHWAAPRSASRGAGWDRADCPHGPSVGELIVVAGGLLTLIGGLMF